MRARAGLRGAGVFKKRMRVVFGVYRAGAGLD